MDRHLTYVTMTRHCAEVQLYGSQDKFNRNGGRLVEHGVAPFEHEAGNRDSYFVTLENNRGEKQRRGASISVGQWLRRSQRPKASSVARSQLPCPVPTGNQHLFSHQILQAKNDKIGTRPNSRGAQSPPLPKRRRADH